MEIIKKVFKVLTITLCIFMITPIITSSTVTGVTKKVKLNYTKKELQVGDYFILKKSGIKGNTKWKSSNPKVAFVDKNGKVKALNKGNAKITCTVGKYKSTCIVTVIVPKAEKIVLSENLLKLEIGEEKTIDAKILPKKSTGGIIFISSDEDVASVDYGRVKAISVGETTITAYSIDDNEIYAECKVEVFEKGARFISAIGIVSDDTWKISMMFTDNINIEDVDINVSIGGVEKTINSIENKSCLFNDVNEENRYITISGDRNIDDPLDTTFTITYKKTDIVDKSRLMLGYH